jgi:hypothetical protein
MKKLIVAALICVISSLNTAAAASPLIFTGSGAIKYESDNADSTGTESGTMYTFTLRGEQKISPKFSLFARFGAQYASNPILADFNRPFFFYDSKIEAAVDQFGLIYSTDKLVYTLGRQEAVIGLTGLLYSRPETNVGKTGFVDGLSIRGSIGSVDISVNAAKENNLWLQNNGLYDIRLGYSLSRNLNMGLTWAQYKYYGADPTNHWAADATANWGKSSLTAEYTQSNLSSANRAYALTWNYGLNEKTALYITNFQVEANGDMGGQSNYDNNNRGFYYGLTHSLSDKLSLEFIYKDQVLLADSSKNTKIELWLKNRF